LNALEKLGTEIPFYFRYVDDIALVVLRHKSNKLLATFNSFHPRMQFTMEIRDEKLDFLDVTLINNKNKLEFDWYFKPSFLKRVLNFLSHHPSFQKRGVIMSMMERSCCHAQDFTKKNLNFIIDIFLNNNYPQFIFDTIYMRSKTLFYKRSKKQ